MLYYQLLNLKDKYQEMDKNTLDELNDILSKSKIFFHKKNNKKINLKNKKNNFNIILNKISDKNYSSILKNEIEKKNINTSNCKKLINLLIDKVEAEGKFVDCYTNFLIDFDRILNKSDNELKIYNIISDKFNKILNSTNEYSKENYYLFIKALIDKGYFYKKLANHIMNKIVDKNKVYDSYLWLNLNPNLKKKYSSYLKNTLELLKSQNNIRLATLFENLTKNKTNSKKKSNKKTIVKNDKNLIKCQNIIKEFLIIQQIEEITYFLEENKNITNLLEDAIIQELFINEDDDVEKIFMLLKKNLVNLENIKTKIKKLNNDDIFIDFNERKKKNFKLLKEYYIQ